MGTTNVRLWCTNADLEKGRGPWVNACRTTIIARGPLLRTETVTYLGRNHEEVYLKDFNYRQIRAE